MRRAGARPGLGVYGRISTGASFSGNERNHLFLSRRGEEFLDVSGVSGADHPQDARAFALLDHDRDGWQDIAIVNANEPRFRLLRNQVSDRLSSPGEHGMVALRFVGGNRSASPSSTWSTRDGYGAKVEVALGSVELVREHRAGEGFSAQNSATLIVGIGRHEGADAVTVRWPSGTVQSAASVPEGTLLTVFENPSDSPTGEAFVATPYRVPSASGSGALAADGVAPEAERRLNLPIGDVDSRLVFYTTMATWCAACRVEMPMLHQLRDDFGEDELAMFGIAIDPADSVEQLEEWMAASPAPYELVHGLSPDQLAAVNAMLLEELKVEGVPVSIITRADGRVLHIQWGPPTASLVRQLLRRLEGAGD